MTGVTSPDLLPYPDDYEQPADVPNALEDLATATQVALDKRTPVAPTSATLALVSGWYHNVDSHGGPAFDKAGRLVIGRGLAKRDLPLTLADNGVYQIGTVPAGYRPAKTLRVPAAWFAKNGTVSQLMTTQLFVEIDGKISVVSNVTGSMVVDQWVSLAGIVWVTP